MKLANVVAFLGLDVIPLYLYIKRIYYVDISKIRSKMKSKKFESMFGLKSHYVKIIKYLMLKLLSQKANTFFCMH